MMNDMTTETLQQLLQTAIDAACAASVPIQAYFGRQSLDVQCKGDGSPVTLADQEAESLKIGRAHV